MTRKIRTIGILVVLAIVFGVVFSILTIQANSINDVEKLKIIETSETSVDLNWHEVSSAEGYYVYASPAGKNDFKKVAEFKSEAVVSANGKLEGLEQATSYDVYVTAFKHNRKKVIESENHSAVKVTTVPSKQDVALSSPDEGLLDIAWNKNEKATGFELEYMIGDKLDEKAFKDAEVKKITKPNRISIQLKELKPEKTYSARIRTYLEVGDETIYGEWSDIKSAVISKKVEMENNVDPTKPMIALTFDDGPGYNSASDKILDVLEKYGARATFFMVGQNAKDHPKNVKRKVALGCEIGNHTYNHSHYGKNVTNSDISKATNAIAKAGGVTPTAFRSPGGNTTEAIRNECKKENMVLYYWSLDTQDWKYRDADKVYNAVMNNVQDGDIILMHEIYDSTAEAVEKMVPKLIKKGYQLVTCEELIKAKTGKAPKAGTQYVNATTIKNQTF